MIMISISDFRKDVKKYAELVRQEDIVVTSNGKPVMKITDPIKDRKQKLKSLKGIVKTDKTCEEVMEEKLKTL
ncbi:MAG: type II toxin-antitoxin system prevent-host-death family antitoxin [Erysipelotrichaceae bacterium]|nr:type II toxin-antitoxin system prevent-host-death family antitoxin [Erysipelotrichaceae bacterium]